MSAVEYNNLQAIKLKPIISYPREAQVGKTYLMSIDVELESLDTSWPYLEEEEYVISFILDTRPFFSYEPLADREPSIVLHRFGGTYGPAEYLLTASTHEVQRGMMGITFINGWGVPIARMELECDVKQKVEIDSSREITIVRKIRKKRMPVLQSHRRSPNSVERIPALKSHQLPPNNRAGLYIDKESRKVWVDGKLTPNKLSRNEVKFLHYLASRHTALCSREEIVLAVYGTAYDRSDDELLDAMVGRIRRKIGDKERPHRFLITEQRRGYRLLRYIEEPDIRSEEERKTEANAAREFLDVNYQARLATFEKQLAYINASTVISEKELAYFIETFKDILSDQEIRKLITVEVGKDSSEVIVTPQLESTKTKKTGELLQEDNTIQLKTADHKAKAINNSRESQPSSEREWQEKQNTDVDIAIIAVREDEFKAVYQRFDTERHFTPSGLSYYKSRVYTVSAYDYTVAITRCSEQGNDAVQKLASDVIHELNPGLILVVGIAGGVPDDEFTLGDVIISTRILNFNIDALHPDGTITGVTRGGANALVGQITDLLPGQDQQLAGWNAVDSIKRERPDVDLQHLSIVGNDNWSSKVRQSLEYHFGRPHNRQRSPLFKTGYVASSNHLVKNPAMLQQWLTTNRQILAVEMETAGVYEAAQTIKHQYPVIAILGISDIVGLERDTKWTAYACQTAAAFTRAFILSGPIDPLH